MISHKSTSSDDFFAHWASVQPMIARTSPIRAGGSVRPVRPWPDHFSVKMALRALISSKLYRGSITAGPLLSQPDHFYFASAGPADIDRSLVGLWRGERKIKLANHLTLAKLALLLRHQSQWRRTMEVYATGHTTLLRR